MIDSITIETSTICNARCIICPNGYQPRKPYMMSLGEFQRIMRRFFYLKGVVLCGMYEPLLDPRLDAILTIIGTEVPKAEITIFTNGFTLNEKTSSILLAHPTGNLVVSIHGFVKPTYEKVMPPLKRDVVYNNVQKFMALKGGVGKKPHVSVSFIRTIQNIHELERFREFWKGKVDLVSDFEPMNWNGAVPFKKIAYAYPSHTRKCPMFDRPLVIDAHGQIVRCCWNFRFSYGHILKDGLKNWRNKKFDANDCSQCVGTKYY